MRRKDKCILTGALIGGGALLGISWLSQWWDKRQADEKLSWGNFDWDNAIKKCVWGIGIGGVGGYLFYNYKISEEEKTPFYSDHYLKKILAEENLKNNPEYLNAVLGHRKSLKQMLDAKLRDKLVLYPQDGGSFAKRTAIASNYDLDILLAFRKDSYSSLEEMYHDVYDVIRSTYGHRAVITKQKRTIGIMFEHGKKEIYFDIVPGRETADFLRDSNLNLYVKSDSLWKKGSSLKTNFTAHRSITINKPEARQIIKLLKMYRDRNNIEIPTVIIEQCVVRAMSENIFGVNSSITENLLNSMDYIAEKLTQLHLPDVANKNNNLNNKLSDSCKSSNATQLIKDITRIEQNPNYIQEIFELQ